MYIYIYRCGQGQQGDAPNISVVFVDEVHERDVNSDFLLIVLKRLIDQGANIKVVLMSATMNSEKFSHFFAFCPIITIPGRMFDVEELYMEEFVSCIAGPLAVCVCVCVCVFTCGCGCGVGVGVGVYTYIYKKPGGREWVGGMAAGTN